MVEIREGTAVDAAVVLSFVRKKAQFDRDLGAFCGELQTSEELIRRHLFGRHPMAYSLLSEAGGLPVGFALFYYRYSSFQGRPSVWLDDLFVNSEARRAGVGLALMRRLAAIAMGNGCSHIGWFASVRNAIGVAFYRRLGATVVHQSGDSVTFQIEPTELLGDDAFVEPGGAPDFRAD